MRVPVNPCSVPPWLRFLLEEETPEQQAACVEHDRAYCHGGTELDRALADARFLVALLENGLEVGWAEAYYNAVRQYGSSHWGGGAWMWARNEVPEA